MESTHEEFNKENVALVSPDAMKEETVQNNKAPLEECVVDKPSKPLEK